MYSRIRVSHIALALTTGLAWQASLAVAQTGAPLAQTEPPTETVSSAQPWLSHQDWFCPTNSRNNANQQALNMRNRMNQLGALGWEVVDFSQASIAGLSCFVATYKAPRRR